jgi:hypothetical protein
VRYWLSDSWLRGTEMGLLGQKFALVLCPAQSPCQERNPGLCYDIPSSNGLDTHSFFRGEVRKGGSPV